MEGRTCSSFEDEQPQADRLRRDVIVWPHAFEGSFRSVRSHENRICKRISVRYAHPSPMMAHIELRD